MNDTFEASALFPIGYYETRFSVNGTLTSVTDSAVVVVPPRGCRRLAISVTGDVYLNTDGGSADELSVLVEGNELSYVDVEPGVPVAAASVSGSSVNVYATPMKRR